jgi:hypothetical protein
MTNTICQKRIVCIATAVAIFGIIQFAGIQSSEAGDWFSITASGNFIPQTDVKTTDARFFTSEFEVELSVPVVEVNYTLTSFSWDKGETLPFGDDQKVPWDQLHKISLAAVYMDKLNDTWAYLFESKGSASFEEQIDCAYLKGRFIGGFRYTLFKEKLYLLLGGGVKGDDFGGTVLPAGGFQWDIGYGLSISVIFPKEAEISYESTDGKLEASVDVLGPSAEIEYVFSQAIAITLTYEEKGTFHRLADDSLVEPITPKKYLTTGADLVSLDLSYSPFEHLICDVGVFYHFSRELELLDDHEETLEKLEINDAVGWMIGFIYTF